MYYLFLLDELFKKDGLKHLYKNFLSDQLKEIGLESILIIIKKLLRKKLF